MIPEERATPEDAPAGADVGIDDVYRALVENLSEVIARVVSFPGYHRNRGVVFHLSNRVDVVERDDVAFLEGPTDPEVGMVCLRDEELKMNAMLLHFTCHPVNVFATQHYTVSPDWPGVWCAGMQEECGETCVPLVLNGCCGNINPWPAFHADFVPDHRRMGRALAETSRHILSSLTFEEEATLDARVKIVPLPLKKADTADRAAAATR